MFNCPRRCLASIIFCGVGGVGKVSQCRELSLSASTRRFAFSLVSSLEGCLTSAGGLVSSVRKEKRCGSFLDYDLP